MRGVNRFPYSFIILSSYNCSTSTFQICSVHYMFITSVLNYNDTLLIHEMYLTSKQSSQNYKQSFITNSACSYSQSLLSSMLLATVTEFKCPVEHGHRAALKVAFCFIECTSMRVRVKAPPNIWLMPHPNTHRASSQQQLQK